MQFPGQSFVLCGVCVCVFYGDFFGCLACVFWGFFKQIYFHILEILKSRLCWWCTFLLVSQYVLLDMSWLYVMLQVVYILDQKITITIWHYGLAKSCFKPSRGKNPNICYYYRYQYKTTLILDCLYCHTIWITCVNSLFNTSSCVWCWGKE